LTDEKLRASRITSEATLMDDDGIRICCVASMSDTNPNLLKSCMGLVQILQQAQPIWQYSIIRGHQPPKQKMNNRREVSQPQQQENPQQPRGVTTGGAVLPRSSSPSSVCGCIEPFGIVLALIGNGTFLYARRVCLDWWVVVASYLLTLVAVVCLFRVAWRYSNERSLSSSFAGVVWMVVSWVLCALAGVLMIVDIESKWKWLDYLECYQSNKTRLSFFMLIGAWVCMLNYAEISRRTGHMTQSTNVVVGDTEAPVNNNDEPSVGPTPPTVIAQEVRGSVLAQEAAEEERNNNDNKDDVVVELPAASYASSYDVPHNKDSADRLWHRHYHAPW
jgi:hypothetical protein